MSSPPLGGGPHASKYPQSSPLPSMSRTKLGDSGTVLKYEPIFPWFGGMLFCFQIDHTDALDAFFFESQEGSRKNIGTFFFPSTCLIGRHETRTTIAMYHSSHRASHTVRTLHLLIHLEHLEPSDISRFLNHFFGFLAERHCVERCFPPSVPSIYSCLDET